MSRTRRINRSAFALAAAAAVSAAVLTLVINRGADAADGRAVRGNFSLASAKTFDDFALFGIGESSNGHNLTAVYRRIASPNAEFPVRANFVSFIYGDCDVSRGACAPPLEVQIWPACERNPSVYQFTSAEAAAVEQTRIRGVPAFVYEGGRRIEVSTGDATVVIFAQSNELALSASSRLVGINRNVGAADPLPRPIPGSMEGDLRCSYDG